METDVTVPILSFALVAVTLGMTAVLARRLAAWHVMIVGISIAVLGAIGAERLIFFAATAAKSQAELFAQGLIAFSAVLGGALVGTAFNELRLRTRV